MSDTNRASALERSRSPLQHSGISNRSESDSGAEEHLQDFIKTFGRIKSDQNSRTREDTHKMRQTMQRRGATYSGSRHRQRQQCTRDYADRRRTTRHTVTSDTISKISRTVENNVLTDSARSSPAAIYIETPAHLDLQSHIRAPIDSQDSE